MIAYLRDIRWSSPVSFLVGFTILLLIGIDSKLALAAGPHGGYSPSTDECATCHRSHSGQSPYLLHTNISGNDFCFTCHNGTGAPLPPFASTHSNIDLAGVEANFELECVQCHEPHGHPNNLSSVRDDVRVQSSPLNSTGPVIFTSRTGTNSFDDGTSLVDSRICIACHVNTSNQGYPMVNHPGGANHLGGANYEAQNCILCHVHSVDEDIYTRDGFMPAGGSCTTCHTSPQGTRRQVVGVGGDFERISHHITSEVQDSDCEVCHELSQHMRGTVRLIDVDTGSVHPLDGVEDAERTEVVCLACHDADGANGLPPFSDSQWPPVVDNNSWIDASHNGSVNVGSCVNCHDNGHGSNKITLLAPYDYVIDGDPDDPMQQEERFCYVCHQNGGSSVYNIASGFNTPQLWMDAANEWNNTHLNDRHDIQLTAQNISGAYIECVNCHDPHKANRLSPPMSLLIADPDPSDGRIPGSNWFEGLAGAGYGTDAQSEWCLDCHDGSLPSGVLPQANGFLEDILNSSPGGNVGWLSSAHGAGVGSPRLKIGYGWAAGDVLPCMACHQAHPNDTPLPITTSLSNNLFQANDTIFSKDGSTPVPADDNALYEMTTLTIRRNGSVSGYYWCNTCHDNSMGYGRANCFECHLHGDNRY